jgi:hypothetical protein
MKKPSEQLTYSTTAQDLCLMMSGPALAFGVGLMFILRNTELREFVCLSGIVIGIALWCAYRHKQTLTDYLAENEISPLETKWSTISYIGLTGITLEQFMPKLEKAKADHAAAKQILDTEWSAGRLAYNGLIPTKRKWLEIKGISEYEYCKRYSKIPRLNLLEAASKLEALTAVQEIAAWAIHDGKKAADWANHCQFRDY